MFKTIKECLILQYLTLFLKNKKQKVLSHWYICYEGEGFLAVFLCDLLEQLHVSDFWQGWQQLIWKKLC